MKLSGMRIGLFLGPLCYILITYWGSASGLSVEGQSILAVTAWMAIWWITEAIPIEVTSLVPLVMFPLSGGLELSQTSQSYGHKFVFLFLGGFILAKAIEKCGLHRRLALSVIRLIGDNIPKIILGFMLTTAFLSMWISNTATTVLMLPIALAVTSAIKVKGEDQVNMRGKMGKALMFAIAYSASIGGMATLIGTPPNLVLAGVVEQFYGTEIGFARWMSFGFPLALVLLGICWVYLTRSAFSLKGEHLPGGREFIMQQHRELGPMSVEEKRVLAVFCVTALAWISRSFLLQKFIPGIDDTIIAISAAVALFIIPGNKNERLMNWEQAVKIPWGILLLFGGGMAIAKGFQETGLAEWIAGQLDFLIGISLLVVMLLLITGVNFLTEITSNMATTATLLPVLAPLAVAMDVHPYALLVPATLAASCAFMLPVATPPNAIVFASGYLRMRDMIRIGFRMNLISIVILVLLIRYVLPVLWSLSF